MLDEFGNYKESVIGFVLDVTLNHMAEGQKAVTHVIQNHSELAYVYVQDQYEVPPRKGMAIGHLLNQNMDDVFNLGVAVKQSLTAINKEDTENKKLFVITNRYKKDRDQYKCMKSICSDKDGEVDIYFFCLDGVQVELENIQKVEVKNLLKDMVAVIDPDYEWPVEEVKEVKKVVKPKRVAKKKEVLEEQNPMKISVEDLIDE